MSVSSEGGMSELQSQSVLLGLTILRELLRETPSLYKRIEALVLSDVDFMSAVPREELLVLLGDQHSAQSEGAVEHAIS